MDPIDVSPFLLANSDQLNGDDLISGPITVQILGVSASAKAEQPVAVEIDGYRPWKPCKTMRRVLAYAWSADASKWIGQWVRLYREASVKFGKEEVGGIRISAMSGISKPIEVALASTKGKKAKHRVDVLVPPMDLDTFRRACGAGLKNGWTREQIQAALGGQAADVPQDMRRGFAEMFAKPPKTASEPEPAPIPAPELVTTTTLSDEEKAAILASERESATE